jgi:hypothetical protein
MPQIPDGAEQLQLVLRCHRRSKSARPAVFPRLYGIQGETRTIFACRTRALDLIKPDDARLIAGDTDRDLGEPRPLGSHTQAIGDHTSISADGTRATLDTNRPASPNAAAAHIRRAAA